jgi:signal transduction histidine kinase
LSHELRTPLNAVLGWAHMLRAGTLPQQVQVRAFDALERNARAQAQLVDDLLDVSRIMSGKLSMKSQPVDLGRVIGDAVDTVRPAADARRLVLEVDVKTAGQVFVLGDGERLQQVVWNLLANAVKFTPTGGSVSVTLQRDDGHVDIVVTDSGEGISPEFLPHVFERFQQADSAPSRKHGGLGLGLALVRHLTEAHGGTAAVHSAGQGQGATFVITLPVVDPAAAASHAETDMPEASRTDCANSDESTASARQSVRS